MGEGTRSSPAGFRGTVSSSTLFEANCHFCQTSPNGLVQSDNVRFIKLGFGVSNVDEPAKTRGPHLGRVRLIPDGSRGKKRGYFEGPTQWASDCYGHSQLMKPRKNRHLEEIQEEPRHME